MDHFYDGCYCDRRNRHRHVSRETKVIETAFSFGLLVLISLAIFRVLVKKR